MTRSVIYRYEMLFIILPQARQNQHHGMRHRLWVLAALKAEENGDGGLAPHTCARLVEPLSKRELEVLRLIAAGLSNQEIAEELVTAVSTVKKHINHIYGQLAVGSRTQALAKAREVGLL